jgi:hypothetical protein
MKESFVNVSIRCAPGAKKAVARYQGLGILAAAWLFVCKDCGARWTLRDFSGAHEPDQVSCSNCYGDHVLIAQIRLQDMREEMMRPEE